MNRMKISVLALLMLAIFSMIFTGCDSGEGVESYFNHPEGPKIIFRGGYGKITIKYTPPPDPIFKVSNATQYIEFQEIKDIYGIPDKPIVIEYLVESSVSGVYASEKTANSRFNEYVQKAVQSWLYTRYGTGQLKVKVDVAKKKITVDADNIRLIPAESGRPAPIVGNARDLVKATGFTIVSGKI